MESILNFGKHKGKTLTECEPSYVRWLASRPMRLAERNRWASWAAKKLLEKKEGTVNYQVGQIVKNLTASHGAAVCIAAITKIDGDKIFATLPEGGTYEYASEDFVPATEQDIIDARKWAERNASMRNPGALSRMDIPESFGKFDEDGVRIA